MRFGSRLPVALVIFFSMSAVSDPGLDAFQRGICHACHTIGGGRLVGPDLAGVESRRSQDWLTSFIRSSQTLIASGDADAVEIFQEYDQVEMPDAPVSDADIQLILAYIATQNPAATSNEAIPVAETQPAVAAPTAEQIALGQDLFQGLTRFENSGPTCNACHDVAGDAVIGGGILARELTDVFPRMGGPGVQAILGQPPFPVMEAAYSTNPLTEEEIDALVAFLQHTGEAENKQMPRDYGVGLFTSGVGGAALIFGSCSLVWRRRKKQSVNQSIYDRQIKST